MGGGAYPRLMDGARRRVTYADLEALPDHVIGELLDGEVVVSPRVALPQVFAGSALGTLLRGPFEAGRGGPGGWSLADEPELRLGPHLVVPDLAGWRRERPPARSGGASIERRPDWVAELVTPASARFDRVTKLDLYGEAGVPYCWLIDPVARILEVFARAEAAWSRIAAWGGDVAVRAPPFDAIELALSDLWGPAPSPSVSP